jgi:hypothetical protein
MWPLCLRSEIEALGLRLNDAFAGTRFYDSGQATTEHFEQCAEFPPLSNRGLGPLAVPVLPIALARRPPPQTCPSAV